MGENSKKWAKRLAYATAVPAVGIFGLAVALGVANRTGLTNEDSAVSDAEQSALMEDDSQAVSSIAMAMSAAKGDSDDGFGPVSIAGFPADWLESGYGHEELVEKKVGTAKIAKKPVVVAVEPETSEEKPVLVDPRDADALRVANVVAETYSLIDRDTADFFAKKPEHISQVAAAIDRFRKNWLPKKIAAADRKLVAFLKNGGDPEEIFARARAVSSKMPQSWRFLPEWLKDSDEFNFVFKGLFSNHAWISKLGEISKGAGADEKLVGAVILTEQTRSAFTQRALVKKYLKSVPFAMSFTQGSKGIGGIKVGTASRIEADAKKYGYGDFFWKGGNDLNDPYWEVAYPAGLVRNITERWKRAKFPIDGTPWIACTLYNLGNPADREPHGDPKVGGAVLDFGEGWKLPFGEICEGFYWYLSSKR